VEKRTLAGLVLTLFLAGCATVMNAQERDASIGKAAPTITAYFAAQELRGGDTWKIYLNASDPDGDMKYIVASIDQAGMGAYSASYTRIAKERRKEFSGYVYLNTMSSAAYTSTIFYNLRLTLQIQDRAGNYSQPVVVPLNFEYRAGAQAFPPSGKFEEKDLGPVMITLKTMTAENLKGAETD
jgi:hypothetical protein